MEHYAAPTPEQRLGDEIVAVLRRHGVETITATDLEKLSRESWQRIVVWHIKEVPLDVEEVGRECFGDEWKADTWI